MMTTLEKVKLGGVILVQVALISVGWMGARWFMKPKIVTIEKKVQVANPERPQQTSNGVVAPAHHVGAQPKPPINTLPDIPHSFSTDVTTIGVTVPTKVKVFHQNALSFSEQKDGYKVWVDSRVWAEDSLGKPLTDINSETVFNKDAQLFIPVTTQVPTERPWAAGLTYSVNTMRLTSMQRVGLFVDRDWGPLRLGAEARLIEVDRKLSPDFTLKGGIRF